MCPESSASTSSVLLRCGFLMHELDSMDEPVPVVVPYSDEGIFIDDLISVMPMPKKGTKKARSPATKHTIDCAAFVNSPPSPSTDDTLTPLSSPLSSPDSGFSSDDTLGSPSTANSSQQKQIRQKRSVRFADAMGLELELVKYYTRDEEILFDYESRTYPPFRMGSLRPLSTPVSLSPSSSNATASTTIIRPPQPHQLHPVNFVYRTHNECAARTRATRVTVSALRPTSPSLVVGQVYVLNVAPEKKVTVRYSLDGWSSHVDVDACWSSGGFPAHDLDIFNFRIAVPAEAKNRRCELCVWYRVDGAVHWDNNEGSNYVLDWKQPEQPRCSPPRASLPAATSSKFATARLRLCSFEDDDDVEIPQVHVRQTQSSPERDSYRILYPSRPSRLPGFR